MWVFNVFLYFLFLFNQPVYQQFVLAGAPCYAYVGSLGNEDPGAPPPCFYLIPTPSEKPSKEVE